MLVGAFSKSAVSTVMGRSFAPKRAQKSVSSSSLSPGMALWSRYTVTSVSFGLLAKKEQSMTLQGGR